jgi:protein O-mannosyl-transferase
MRSKKGRSSKRPNTIVSPGRALRGWPWGVLLIAATVVAYWPAMRGEFVFDDDTWTKDLERVLSSASGLWQMWSNPAVLQQYYPLTGTTFWLDRQIWGWWTTPYHLENVLLHAASAILLWRLLLVLEVPGALLAAAVFALHPAMAESVAWITERKNVLSQLLFLAALTAYGRQASFWTANHPPARSPAACYVLALVLFTAALLAKTTAFALPAVVLLLAWWKRGRIDWRQDVLPTLPFFALATIAGLGAAWIETHQVGAQGADWDRTWQETILVAGRVPWFYAGKLLFPINQCFVYPRWELDAGSLLQWLYPATAIAFLLLAWLFRARLGRGLSTAAFYFTGTLLPVLGFMNVFGMRYSYVADRWLYLSSLGVLVMAAALTARIAGHLRVPPKLGVMLALPALLLLATLTWHQAAQYRDAESLWRRTLAGNPACWLAHNSLGVALVQADRFDEAIASYQKALAIKPDYAEARNNLAVAYLKKGRPDEAISQFEKALALQPDYAHAHCNLGATLAQMGRLDEAIAHYEEALKILPEYPQALGNLGNACLQKGRFDEAIAHYQKALSLASDNVGTHNNLGSALFQTGRVREAVGQFEIALKLDPAHLDALTNLALMLATSFEPSLRDGPRAVELATQASRLAGREDPLVMHALAAAHAECGRFAEAADIAQRALSLASAQGNAGLAGVIRNARELYLNGRPLHDARPASGN